MRENYIISSNSGKKGVSKDITKEGYTLTEETILIHNKRHIEAHEHKLDTYTGGRNPALLGSLIIRANKLLIISTTVYETSNSKATALANGIISKDKIIAWVKK